jgi:hypothetical protein
MIKSWKKKEFKKLAKVKKIAKKKKRTIIKFDGKKPMEDEVVRKKQFKKWLQTKKIVIKRMKTKFERLKK